VIPGPTKVIDRIRGRLHGPTGAIIVTNLAILGGNAVAGITSARVLGPAGRGELAVVILWTALINVIGMLGIPSACIYYVAHWPQRRDALAAYFRRTMVWQGLAMTVASGLVLWWLHHRLHLSTILTWEYVSWTAGANVGLYAMAYVQGLGSFRQFNIIRAVSGGLPAVPMIVLALSLRLTPAEAGAAYLVPTWAAAVLGYRWLRQDRGTPGPRSLTPQERRTVLSYSWRSLGSYSALNLNANADQLIVGLLASVTSLGIYNVAASASSPLTSLITSVGMVGLPTVAAMTGRARVAATWAALRRTALPVALFVPPAAILLPWLIPLLYGSHYRAATLPAELLLAGVVFAALATVTDDLLRANGHPGFSSISQGVGAITTALGAVLFARHSIVDVAAISAVGYAAAFALAVIRLRIVTRWVPKHEGRPDRLARRSAMVTQAASGRDL
jgi:O-antigen/teichoic acid export membrane protein